ncbi:MAG: pilus assembly protein PilM [Candidatus Nomurabacteria bacterium]|nr:pilus assembly protein PilM [Candidatus Nomurabacteria bacterium]
MSIINLLIKEKRIAGIEINDSIIRIAYIRLSKKSISDIKNNTKDELILIEEPVPENTISNGTIIDKDNLIKTLKKVWNNKELQNLYAIVSIPEDKIYSRIFQFPKDITKDKLKEAVDLAVDFQSPFKRDDVYLGWENEENHNLKNEVLLSAIYKKIADEYIDVLNKSGINILTLESHLASINRAIELNPEEKTLITKTNQDSITFFVLKNSFIKFSRTIPKNFTKQDNFLSNEVNKIKNSLETEDGEKIFELSLTECKIKNEYRKYKTLTNETELQSKWLIAMGAFVRGEIPKGKDNQISLLSVGMAEAYKYQKLKAFSTLIRNMIISVSLFFLFTFIVTYLFIFSFYQKINKTNINIAATSTDALEKESLVRKTNSLTNAVQSILVKTPNWSILLEDIKGRTIQGIIISSLSIPSINDPMSMVGIAKDRNTLNNFKKSLEKSTYLTMVELPITNLEKKADIPFSISFNIKDPNLLYFK